MVITPGPEEQTRLSEMNLGVGGLFAFSPPLRVVSTKTKTETDWKLVSQDECRNWRAELTAWASIRRLGTFPWAEQVVE